MNAFLLCTSLRRRTKVDEYELTSLEPAFALAEMEAFRAIGAHMTPAAFFSIWTLYALIEVNLRQLEAMSILQTYHF